MKFTACLHRLNRRRLYLRTQSRVFALAVWFLAMVTLVPPAKAVSVQLITSRNPSVSLPAGGDDNSAAPDLSPDGRFVVFTSAANDLVPSGNNFPSLNVFRRDRLYGTTVLVSGNASGTGGGNGHSTAGQASTYGRYVVFQSEASDLVPGDTNGVSDIFLRDTYTGTTRLISAAMNGDFASGASTDPVMTPDGTCVAFISAATNLVAGDTNGIPDVFVRDLITQTTWRVSVNAIAPTSALNPIMATPVITPDGRYVAFFSSATNLVSAVPITSTGEVYVRDRVAGTTTWASTNAAAMVWAALGLSGVPAYHPRLSDDGRYLAFKAGPLSPTTAAALILRYDTVAAATTAVNSNGVGWYIESDDSGGPEMTPDGRYIAFARHEGTSGLIYSSVHVWDAQGAADTLVSDNGSGVPTNTTSYMPVISADGRFVAFLSNATNLVANPVTTNNFHIYLRDLQSSTTALVDVDTNGLGSSDETMSSLSLSADGRYVAFSSPDGRLVSGDRNRAEDVFVRDTVGGTMELISQRDATVVLQAGNGNSLAPISVSADGRWLAFVSEADDLVPNDTNRLQDVFVRDLITGTNLLVSAGLDGGPALGGNSLGAVISANGRYVAFVSSATNLTADVFPTNNNNVFRRDLQTGTTVLISAGTNATSSGNYDSSDPVISTNGRYVAFLSTANNLVAGINGGTFWRDVNLGHTVGMPGIGAFRPSMTDDGLYVAYSAATGLRIRDAQWGTDTYINTGAVGAPFIDPTGTKILYLTNNNSSISRTLCVEDITNRSNLFSIKTTAQIRNAGCWSDDGRWLTFIASTNPAAGDDGINKVYLLDFQTGTLSLIGLAGPGNNGKAGLSDGPVISGDGRFIAYRSLVTNTVIGNNTTPPNVFLLDRLTGSNTVLTAGPAVPGPRLWVSRPIISGDGSTVAFLHGSGLVSGDLNRLPDAFGASVDVNAARIDTDGDGIPDWWMLQHFGHPTGQANDNSLAADDADGDGASNAQEYLVGTDPLNPYSVFQVSMAASTNAAITLTWPAVTGKSYQVEYTTNLTDSVWLTAPGNVWVTGWQGYYIAPAAQPHCFYRVLGSN
jgi:Tol biopolymer transport system component